MSWSGVRMSLGVALAFATVAACGPGSVDDEGSGSAGSSGGTSVGGTTTGPTSGAGTEDDSATSADTGTGTADGGSTTEDPPDTTTGQPDQCVAPQPMAAASFSVQPAEQDISAVCMVLALGGDPGTTTIDLDCEGEAVTVTVTNEPYQLVPFLGVGDSVRLEVANDPIFWTNRWLALFTTGGLTDRLLVAGISGSALDPPGTTLDAFLDDGSGGPSITEAVGLCNPEPGDCSEIERVALDLTLSEGQVARALDRSAVIVDILAYGYGFIVQSAVHNLPPVQCDDLPDAWYEVLAIYFPSD